jgi:hypothetical protein
VAHLQRRAVTEICAIRERSTEHRDLARPSADAGTEGLLFYLSAHAQAVSELSEAPWMRWLELRSLADQQRGVSSESNEVTPLFAGGVNDSRGLYITLMDARGQRLSSLHKRNAMESTRPERFMVDNKR